jgi:hypothetical protein
MMSRILATTAALVAAANFFTACDKGPTSPTLEFPQAVSNVELFGPQSIAPGETVQFRLIAQFADRSTRDVTTEAHWRQDSRKATSTSTSGLITGLNVGEARVMALFNGHQGSKDVLVLPAGTYRLMGTVTAADLPSEVVEGALVEVTIGAGTGITADTDSIGQYRLYGVSGEIGLRVTKDGYESAAHSVFVADHRASHHTKLTPIAPRVGVSGTYTLTITAARECGTGLGEGRLPTEARVRAYSATVQQTGSRLEVRVASPTTHYGTIFGRAEPGRVLFDLAWYDDSGIPDPSIIEQLGSETFLAVRGKATAVGSADRLEGTLHGDLWVFVSANGWGSATASCSAMSHQFVLSR